MSSTTPHEAKSSKPGRISSSIDLRGCVCQEGNSEGSRTMDETKTREHVQAHAEAVERGDMDAVVADFSDELQPQVPEIAKALPQPVTSAEVVSLEVGEGEGVALIRYSGDTGELTIRSRWQDQGGRPVIVAAEPAG